MRNQSRQHPVFFQITAWQGALETALLSLLMFFGISSLKGLSTDILQFYVFMIIGPLSSLWYALRLRRVEGTRKRQRKEEFKSSILLVLALSLFVWLPAVLFGYAGLTDEEIIPGAVFLTIPSFLLFRFGICLFRFWDSLKREYMIWSMTSSILMAVYIGTLLIIPIFVVIIISENIPPNVKLIDWLFSNLVSTAIPVAGGLIVIFAVIEIILVLPPALFISYLIARRITRRLENLAKATIALRSGDYNMRVVVDGSDEVARLQTDFNAMAVELQRSRVSLQTERDKVAGLLKIQRELTINVSHELRTPVATVKGYLEPIMQRLGDHSSMELKHDLQIIEREIEHLNRLINDLFIISQAEVNKLVMKPCPTDVTEVIELMVKTFSKLAWQRSRVEIISEIGIGIPLAFVDSLRLEQILANLLRNAIRHTLPGGLIAVQAIVVDSFVSIKVRDTGEGISSEDLSQIWKRFYRVQSSSASSEEGGGLGLAVVKELTEAMGGNVAVESVLGEGTVFSLRFPIIQEEKD
ncbi:MAG: HAMP domain-containing histidine kinase [Anaerolineaceae bacterium]|nr:HAMP domain-containing histidine kinase [Anaerolineaceae bacterium]